MVWPAGGHYSLAMKKLVELACCGLCCAGASMAAAAPPISSNNPAAAPAGLLGRASGLLTAKSTRARSGRLDFSRLDLRPPDTAAAAAPEEHQMPATAAFPSFKRQSSLADEHAVDDNDLPELGKGSVRVMSKPEEIARRVQREGLPLARLWESHSALLSLGLSPRGKPGLWLIQKLP